MSIMSHEERLKIHVEIQMYASLNQSARWLVQTLYSKDGKRLTATFNIDIFYRQYSDRPF